MTDPITRLNATLGGRYRVEREIGEGGMASGLDYRQWEARIIRTRMRI